MEKALRNNLQRLRWRSTRVAIDSEVEGIPETEIRKQLDDILLNSPSDLNKKKRIIQLGERIEEIPGVGDCVIEERSRMLIFREIQISVDGPGTDVIEYEAARGRSFGPGVNLRFWSGTREVGVGAFVSLMGNRFEAGGRFMVPRFSEGSTRYQKVQESVRGGWRGIEGWFTKWIGFKGKWVSQDGRFTAGGRFSVHGQDVISPKSGTRDEEPGVYARVSLLGKHKGQWVWENWRKFKKDQTIAEIGGLIRADGGGPGSYVLRSGWLVGASELAWSEVLAGRFGSRLGSKKREVGDWRAQEVVSVEGNF